MVGQRLLRRPGPQNPFHHRQHVALFDPHERQGRESGEMNFIVWGAQPSRLQFGASRGKHDGGCVREDVRRGTRRTAGGTPALPIFKWWPFARTLIWFGFGSTKTFHFRYEIEADYNCVGCFHHRRL